MKAVFTFLFVVFGCTLQAQSLFNREIQVGARVLAADFDALNSSLETAGYPALDKGIGEFVVGLHWKGSSKLSTKIEAFRGIATTRNRFSERSNTVFNSYGIQNTFYYHIPLQKNGKLTLSPALGWGLRYYTLQVSPSGALHFNAALSNPPDALHFTNFSHFGEASLHLRIAEVLRLSFPGISGKTLHFGVEISGGYRLDSKGNWKYRQATQIAMPAALQTGGMYAALKWLVY
ncbi:MAG: hypothetical protein IPL35_02015 [Sphingobacteriales bacterium]|nr:hypothetical protein [Sphingobacteriales bacterium]